MWEAACPLGRPVEGAGFSDVVRVMLGLWVDPVQSLMAVDEGVAMGQGPRW